MFNEAVAGHDCKVILISAPLARKLAKCRLCPA
jgi:hypothetical protein